MKIKVEKCYCHSNKDKKKVIKWMRKRSHNARWSFILPLVSRLCEYKHDNQSGEENVFYTFSFFLQTKKVPPTCVRANFPTVPFTKKLKVESNS